MTNCPRMGGRSRATRPKVTVDSRRTDTRWGRGRDWRGMPVEDGTEVAPRGTKLGVMVGQARGGNGTKSGRATEAYRWEAVVGAAHIGIEPPKCGNSEIDGG